MFPDLTRDDVFRLETRRLWLRWPRASDVPAIVRLAGEKAVAEMTTRIPHPYERLDGERFVLGARQANAEGRRLTLAVAERAKPACAIGMVGIAWDDPAAPFIGYWLGTPHWDKGYMTEAARGLIDAFFAYADGQVLAASARVVDPGSRRVLEKCGFTAVGSSLKAFPARGGIVPVDEFRLDRRDWESVKARSHAGLVPRARHDGGVRA